MFHDAARLFQDRIGSILIRNWIRMPDNNSISHIKIYDHDKVIALHSDFFGRYGVKQIIKYIRIFEKISYIYRKEDNIIGYCLYYIKPQITFRGIEKIAVIYSMAVDEKSRRKGVAEGLLRYSIEEMKLNKVFALQLYYSKNNLPAKNLYNRFMFEIVGDKKDCYGPNKDCYKLQLIL